MLLRPLYDDLSPGVHLTTGRRIVPKYDAVSRFNPETRLGKRAPKNRVGVAAEEILSPPGLRVFGSRHCGGNRFGSLTWKGNVPHLACPSHLRLSADAV